MKIYKMAERELNEIEEKTIKHFRYYYDEKKSFALIGEYVVAVLSDDYSGNLEHLKKETLDHISKVLSTPPDFNTYIMDDKFGLVEMNEGIYGISADILSREEIETREMDIVTALAIRSLCIEACENHSIIAINDEQLPLI